MAAKTENIATMGNLIAAGLTFLVGIPFAYLGAITRTYYGPDTPRASFLADTCSRAIGLPTCGLWQPGARARARRAPPTAHRPRTRVRAACD